MGGVERHQASFGQAHGEQAQAHVGGIASAGPNIGFSATPRFNCATTAREIGEVDPGLEFQPGENRNAVAEVFSVPRISS